MATTPTAEHECQCHDITLKLADIETRLSQLQRVCNSLVVDERLFLIRQIAYSYQHKLSCYVGLPLARIPRPHHYVYDATENDSVKRSKLQQVASHFPLSMYPYPYDISEAVEYLIETTRRPYKERGSNDSVDGIHIRETLKELLQGNQISQLQYDIASDVLVAIEFMLPALGNPPLLAWEQKSVAKLIKLIV